MADQESSTTQLIETIREAMSKMTEQRYPTTAEAMLRRAWNEGGNSEGAVAFIRENFDKPEEFWRATQPAQTTPEVETLRRKIEEKEATKVMLQSMGEDSTQLDNEIADLQTRIEQGDAMAELWNEWTKETMVTMILEQGGEKVRRPSQVSGWTSYGKN